MSAGLTGTPAAYVRCAGCGHARHRHLGGGAGACAAVTYVPRDARAPGAAYVPLGCPCEAFIEPEPKE